MGGGWETVFKPKEEGKEGVKAQQVAGLVPFNPILLSLHQYARGTMGLLGVPIPDEDLCIC